MIRISLKKESAFWNIYTGGAWLSSARVVRCWVKSRNISRHELTTAMHHLCICSKRHFLFSKKFISCQTLVRFFALHRIKPHAPPLVRAPVNSFEFHSCEHTSQAGYLTR